MKNELTVGFIGNPNCGKTTLFNAYTGAKLKVANWPGVTVEKKEGAMKYHNHIFQLVDLPGIYSLTSYTMEEKLSRQFILDSEVDVIVDVADASALERNLYLTLQLIELGKPVILALNMMDIVIERGMEIDLHRLPEVLGIPCIPVSARRKTGLDILMHTVAHHKEESIQAVPFRYTEEIEKKIEQMIQRFEEHGFKSANDRWYAIKLLEHDVEVQNLVSIDVSDIVPESLELEIINQKYNFINTVVEECLVNKSKKAEKTDRIDHYLTHPILGLPIFLGIMALVFFLTFTLGDAFKMHFESAFAYLRDVVLSGLQAIHTNPVLTSLIVDGIITGVGGILTFLPNIAILFLALAFLEDSGYMARVAYVMDGIMSKLGLSGRAFIPMVLGFGCSVPAIMASRALEDMKDRRKTILLTPFMSCSAKLPIYVLFSGMFFGKWAPIVAFSMYLIGLILAVFVAFLMKRFDKQGGSAPLLIELPEYKTPNKRSIAIYVWEKIKDYLTKAGTTIFLASIVIWFLLNFGPSGMTDSMADSFGAHIGRVISPALEPAGLGFWQVAVSLISGLAAKEVVVSSFSVLFDLGNSVGQTGVDSLVTILRAQGFGAINAYAMMLFCLLYTPCMATIAVIKKELKSVKWTLFTVFFQLFTAYIVTVIFYQLARLIF